MHLRRAGRRRSFARSDNTATSASCTPTATLHGNTADTYFNWIFYQRGPTNLPPYDYGVYVDNVVLSGYNFRGPVPAYDYYVSSSGAHTIRGGRHTVTADSDVANATPETNESDNSYTAQYIWSPLAVGEGAPLLRTVPPASLGPQSFPLVNADGFRYTRSSGVAWVVSEAARTALDDDDLSAFDDYTGTSSGLNNSIGTSRWGSNYTDFVVGHYSGTPITMFPAVGYYTGGGGAGSYAIDAISATGRNGTADANATWTAQTLGPYTSTETGWHPIVVYRDNGTNSDQPVTHDFAFVLPTPGRAAIATSR